MSDQTNIVVLPTFDEHHYGARARRYGREAAHEPDLELRLILQGAARRCRRMADPSAAFTRASDNVSGPQG